jgi:hypothetical protein
MEVREMLDYMLILLVIGVIAIGVAATIYYNDTHGHGHNQ